MSYSLMSLANVIMQTLTPKNRPGHAWVPYPKLLKPVSPRYLSISKGAYTRNLLLVVAALAVTALLSLS